MNFKTFTMKKELKFRAWNSTTKKFEYFELHNITVPDRLLCQHDYPVQQFTGLKDKNDKEIYEGDLVKIIYGENLIAEVYHQTNMGCLRLKCNDGQSYPFVVYRFDESNKPIGVVNVAEEVIGNIFENGN